MRLIDADILVNDDRACEGIACKECPFHYDDGCKRCDFIQNYPAAPAIPIPDNATNGDVIKALFPRIKIKKYPTFLRVIEGEEYIPMTYDWWNAPYKGGN